MYNLGPGCYIHNITPTERCCDVDMLVLASCQGGAESIFFRKTKGEVIFAQYAKAFVISFKGEESPGFYLSRETMGKAIWNARRY